MTSLLTVRLYARLGRSKHLHWGDYIYRFVPAHIDRSIVKRPIPIYKRQEP